jgi:hypothetical protein
MKYPIDHIWVAFVAVITINAMIWWRRGRSSIARNPELAHGYKRLILGFLVLGNIPWVVMGLGFLTGGITSILDYLRPSEANPWVLGWYLTAVCLWLMQLWWLFIRNGAKTLVDHPGLFNIQITNPNHVKLFACAGTISMALGIALAFGHGLLVPYWTTRSDVYTTVFIVYDGFWRIVAIALLFWTIGTVALVFSIKMIRQIKVPKWWNQKGYTKLGGVLLWSILWLSLSVAGFSVNLYRSYQLVSAYRDGTAQIVEGTVHVLRTQPWSGHAAGDLVEINGVELGVDYFVVTPAYKQTIAYGGALREGTSVRAWCCNGKVLRLDVKQ